KTRLSLGAQKTRSEPYSGSSVMGRPLRPDFPLRSHRRLLVPSDRSSRTCVATRTPWASRISYRVWRTAARGGCEAGDACEVAFAPLAIQLLSHATDEA